MYTVKNSAEAFAKATLIGMLPAIAIALVMSSPISLMIVGVGILGSAGVFGFKRLSYAVLPGLGDCEGGTGRGFIASGLLGAALVAGSVAGFFNDAAKNKEVYKCADKPDVAISVLPNGKKQLSFTCTVK